jgi:hypothetical protein
VSTDSITALREVHAIKLDRFETRKIVFNGDAIARDTISAGIANAVEFELLWLKNKRNYYSAIAIEDEKRIAMMEARRVQPEPARLYKVA